MKLRSDKIIFTWLLLMYKVVSGYYNDLFSFKNLQLQKKSRDILKNTLQTTTTEVIKTQPFFKKFKPPKQLKIVLSVGIYINIS